MFKSIRLWMQVAKELRAIEAAEEIITKSTEGDSRIHDGAFRSRVRHRQKA